MSLQASEAESAAVAKAPRVSLADIEAAIEHRFDLNASDAVGAAACHVVLPSGKSSIDALRPLSAS